MISNFIYLNTINSSLYSIEYICSLPDPDINNDDSMVDCGNIKVNENFCTGMCTIEINLFDNFESLCVGEVYQRKHFVQTLLDIIELNSDFELADAKIILTDFVGKFEGYLIDLEEKFY